MCPYRQRSIRLWWDPDYPLKRRHILEENMLGYIAAGTLKLNVRIQDRQCTWKVTQRRVLVAIVALKKR